ncbi:MAG: hypothetical protein DMF63_16285 [Acidobacteria bacterium]|nr:MAG: hypothetical protein DMF63_16285 [Acidobacteriota bacterium]
MHDFLEIKQLGDNQVLNHFQDFFSAYASAAAAVGTTTELNVEVARRKVDLHIAGNDLAAKLTRAIQHRRTDASSAKDAALYIFESEKPEHHLPPFFVRLIEIVKTHPNPGLRRFRGDIPVLTNHRFRAAMTDFSFTMADIETSVCVHWVAGANSIPSYELAAPLRVPFNFILNSATRQLVHGGAVGNEKGGVFLGGVGGSGKSTTAINSLSSSELRYAGDDYVLLDFDRVPVAFNLYGTAKVKSVEDTIRFPRFKDHFEIASADTSFGKPVLFVTEHFPDKIAAQLPLNAIVFPKFEAGAKLQVAEMSRQVVFREIATSTVRQTAGNEHETVALIGRLVRELPCYKLTFGEEQSGIPDALIRIIEKT